MNFYKEIKVKNMFIALGLLLSPVSNYARPMEAITKVPIADLVGDSLQTMYQSKQIPFYYNNLPLCGQRLGDCLRVHQLLFNERFTILEEKNNEVLVQVPSVFYELEDSNQRFNTYWSLKKNFITLDELNKLKVPLQSFPQSIDYTNNTIGFKKVIALISPFKDSATQQLFSVGTRFVINQYKKNLNVYSVSLFDPVKNRVIMSDIPAAFCRLEDLTESYQKRIHDFVKLLKSWSFGQGIIPYVWGGCSFTQRLPCSKFELLEKNNDGKKVGYYNWIGCKQSPKAGFDCTGIVARAAQICRLPYYFKNTTTVVKNLKSITSLQQLSEGDLIWLPGHIMVVASKANNTLIEARAYSHGFGKIQEIELEKVFRGMKTFDQLCSAHNNKQSLQRLNSGGTVVQVIPRFALLKLDSLWTKGS